MYTLRRNLFFLTVFTLVMASLPAVAQRVTATLQAQFSQPSAIAVNSVTNRAYIIDQALNTVTIVNGATNQLTTVSVGNGPDAIGLNPVTNKIYIANSDDDTVTVMDGATLSTTTVSVGDGPAVVAVNSVTNKIYIANANDNTLTVIDGSTLATSTITVGDLPVAIAINPVTNKIYVGNQTWVGYSSITVIDGATNTTTTIYLEPCSFAQGGLAVNSVTNQIFAYGRDYLYVIDGTTGNVDEVGLQFAGCPEADIVVSTATDNVYITDYCDNIVQIVTAYGEPVGYFGTGNGPYQLSIDTTRSKIYVANFYGDSLTIFDEPTFSIVTIAVPGPEFSGINPVTNVIYVVTANASISVVAGATPLQFVRAAPCRLVDTRQSGGPIQGGTSRSFNPTQLGNCDIPTTAAAYSLNVTAVPSGPLGYLTIWPDGQSQPTVSTMNSFDGRIKANAAIVAAGQYGAVDVFVSNTSNVLIDIDGYFTPPSAGTLQFYPVTPCRVADTRNGDGDLGGPFLQANQERDFPLVESSCLQRGVTPQAYSLNLTAVPHASHQPLGYLTAWATGQPRPVVSTLNNPTGTYVANAAVVPAGTAGAIDVFPDGSTDLVIDINGYFAPPGQGGLSLNTIAPCRAFDSRQDFGAFHGELEPPVNVGIHCNTGATAQAFVLNATVVPTGDLGYLTLWPDPEPQPDVSTLNAADGAVTSNMAIVPNINGNTDAYAAGTTQLIVDVSSYFAP
jgi:YVTN family beta-propeller protein